MLALLKHQQAAQNAYAPYSQFRVGAALLTQSGNLITGANVENASYGLTLCAERVALVKAVSDGHRDLVAMAVWGADCPEGTIMPCGACRQMMLEFFPPDAPIIVAPSEQVFLKDLLPRAFVLT